MLPPPRLSSMTIIDVHAEGQSATVMDIQSTPSRHPVSSGFVDEKHHRADSAPEKSRSAKRSFPSAIPTDCRGCQGARVTRREDRRYTSSFMACAQYLHSVLGR